MNAQHRPLTPQEKELLGKLESQMPLGAAEEKIWELRAIRGDAALEVEVDLRLVVRVIGESMSQFELRTILDGHMAQLKSIIEDRTRINTDHAPSIGWTPDGNRQAYVDELLEVFGPSILEVKETDGN